MLLEVVQSKEEGEDIEEHDENSKSPQGNYREPGTSAILDVGFGILQIVNKACERPQASYAQAEAETKTDEECNEERIRRPLCASQHILCHHLRDLIHQECCIDTEHSFDSQGK